MNCAHKLCCRDNLKWANAIQYPHRHNSCWNVQQIIQVLVKHCRIVDKLNIETRWSKVGQLFALVRFAHWFSRWYDLYLLKWIRKEKNGEMEKMWKGRWNIYKGDSRGQSRLEKMHLPFPYPRLDWDAVRECLTETKNTKCISATSRWSDRGGSDGVCRTAIGDDHVCCRRRSLLPSEVNAVEHEHETAVVVAEDHWCLGAGERHRSLEVETTAAGEEWKRWETERRDCISQERKKIRRGEYVKRLSLSLQLDGWAIECRK